MNDTIEDLRAQLAAEKARAEDLSRTVAAMGEAIKAADIVSGGERIDAILSRPDVTAERGRWVPLPSSPWLAGIYSCPPCSVIWTAWGPTTVQPRGSMSCHGEPCSICEPLDVVPMDRIEVADFINERDAAIARAESAERARDALGIQLAAQSERLRLAMAVVEAARWVMNRYRNGLELHDRISRLGQTIAALDAVPGDALARYEAIANKRNVGPEE